MKPYIIFELHRTEFNAEFFLIGILIVLTALQVLNHTFISNGNKRYVTFNISAYSILGTVWVFTIMSLK